MFSKQGQPFKSIIYKVFILVGWGSKLISPVKIENFQKAENLNYFNFEATLLIITKNYI